MSGSPALQADFLPCKTPGKPILCLYVYSNIKKGFVIKLEIKEK